LSNTKLPGPRPTSIPSGILIYPVVWPQRTWAVNWGTVPHFWRRAGSPSNKPWPGTRPTCMPSFILIRPRPQYTNVTDRTDSTDRQTGQRSDSTGRTVLQMVAQKGKGYPYSIPSVGPGVDPGVQAVSPQMTVSHPPGGRLPLLSARLVGYLPSRRASPPFRRYQVTLFGDRGTYV